MTTAGFRYGGVLLLMFTLVVFSIVSSGGADSRAVALALEGAALALVIATSRDSPSVRRARLRGLATAGVAVVVLLATDALPVSAVLGLSIVLGLAILVALGRGLRRLVRLQGVTLQVVAGALGIYLMVGLIFGWLIAVIANAGDGGYFVGAGDVPTGEGIYYSFTVLTTTGFGDLTPAQPVGRALGVLEMLIGQIYLVTVIGVIIGNLSRSHPSPTAPGEA